MTKRAVKLFGTETPEPKVRTLTAGAISAVLDNGALRYIKLDGIEVLRAIAFLVRDENWGTYTPKIDNLRVRQTRDGFAVSYDAHCGDGKSSLSYSAKIEASAKGSLSFSATATPDADFMTNRTGFVVLHPLKGVAGEPVTVEHVDGKIVKDKFPRIINPVQPFFDVRALTHKVAPGITATVRMEGDSFEMEDHRNWTDASFKTYVRPLALPWPYKLKKGESFEQSVSVTFAGKLPKPRKARRAKPIDVSIGPARGKIPAIGAGVPSEQAAATLDQSDLIKALGLKHLICRITAGAGGMARAAAAYRTLKQRTGAGIGLEIVIPGKGAADDGLAPAVKDIATGGLEPDAVAVSTAADLKATLPGSEGGSGPTLKDIYDAARAAFPKARIGGGMFSYFTELNRKPPPAALLDFVTHTTCPAVHAADDVSVMETLEALPYVIESAKKIVSGKAYHVGPSAIPCRDNPYGKSVAPNPDNGRVCLSDLDPRQRGLFGAAWTLGYLAAFSEGGAASIAMGSITGPAGLVYRKASYAQPGYDERKDAAVYPLYHVMAGLAPASGAKRLATTSANPSTIAALAHASPQGQVLWLANLTGAKQKVRVSGFDGAARQHVIDEASFDKATKDPSFLAKGGKLVKKVGAVELGPYAVMRLQAA